MRKCNQICHRLHPKAMKQQFWELDSDSWLATLKRERQGKESVREVESVEKCSWTG